MCEKFKIWEQNFFQRIVFQKFLFNNLQKVKIMIMKKKYAAGLEKQYLNL